MGGGGGRKMQKKVLKSMWWIKEAVAYALVLYKADESF